MSEETYKTRVGIDNQTINSLFLANGGGVIALMALLPQVIDDPKKVALSIAILVSLVILCLGVCATIRCNHYRRLCSLNYDRNRETAPRSKACRRETNWRIYACCPLPIAGFVIFIGGIIVLCTR